MKNKWLTFPNYLEYQPNLTKFTNYFLIDQEKVYGKYEANLGNIVLPILL